MDVNRYISDIPLIRSDQSNSNHLVRYVMAHEYDRVTAERDALQLRLNAVEEENDRLRGHVLCLCAGANAEMHESWECTSYHPLLVRAVSDAEKALEKRP